MKKRKKKSGKEMAKLNIRKKFYSKLERKYSRLQDEENKLLFLSMNNNISFPESDDLTMYLDEVGIEMEMEEDIEKSNTIEIVYMEELEFLKRASESGLIKVYQQETELNNDGEPRKGVNSYNDDYHYQEAFNWAILIAKNENLGNLISQELEEPSEYDMTPEKAEIQEPVYYRNKPYRRRRRR